MTMADAEIVDRIAVRIVAVAAATVGLIAADAADMIVPSALTAHHAACVRSQTTARQRDLHRQLRLLRARTGRSSAAANGTFDQPVTG
jgi:hypothetical protein